MYITGIPSGAWVVQQARNLAIELAERTRTVRFLVRDRDTKFTSSFDEIFRSEGIRIIRAPVRAPRANAFAERFVGSIRRECLDRILILGRRHLEGVLKEFVDHYNSHRPHRSLGQLPPQPKDGAPAMLESVDASRLRRTDQLGGLIHEYHLVA
ncbi:MAG: integrase core domain-containing protein [Acidimicrobiales bacterium]